MFSRRTYENHGHEARQDRALQKRLPILFLKSHAIQSLSWCSHCDPNDALEKRAWRRRIGLWEQTLNLRVFLYQLPSLTDS